MPGTETSPDPALSRIEQASEHDMEGGVPAVPDEEGPSGFVDLFRDLAEDTRTLVQQEVELARLELARSAKRIAKDGGWIWAGAVVLTVGGICLALALALGLGTLLDSYWLGALITGGVFLLIGALLAWRGIRDLKAGGLLPSNPLASLQEDRDWARRELEELKQGITEDT